MTLTARAAQDTLTSAAEGHPHEGGRDRRHERESLGQQVGAETRGAGLQPGLSFMVDCLLLIPYG